jgi:hypothetical protein
MLVHSCRCIFLFLMIGFYYKRKGFQKLFENVFGKFEIEKEKKECPLLCFRPEGCCRPSSAIGPLGLSSPRAQFLSREPQRAGPAEATGRLALAAVPFFLSVSLTSGPVCQRRHPLPPPARNRVGLDHGIRLRPDVYSLPCTACRILS